MLEATTTTGAAMPSPSTKHESDDHYQAVIYANDKWRVIASRCDTQWITQRAKISGHGRDWRGVDYHKARKPLIRVWDAKTGDYNGAVALGALPERIGGKHGA